VIYTCYFWDFDGTLYDTYGRVTRAVQKTIRTFGVEASFEALYPLLKRSFGTMWERYLKPRGVDYQLFLDTYHAMAEDESMDEVLLYPGAREILTAVKAMGGRNFLYTHRNDTAFAYLDRDGLTELFTDFITSLHGFSPKPAPDALNYLVEKHGLDPRQCVMVGDRGIDVDAGRNAGMAGVLFDPENYYADYPADYRFQHLNDMMQVLQLK